MSSIQFETKEKQSEVLLCRLTPSEKETIKRLASEHGMGMTDLIRSVVRQLAA